MEWNGKTIAGLILLLLAMAAAVLFAFAGVPGTEEPAKTEDSAAFLFFALDEADSILIRQGESTMLIDAGEKKHGEMLVERLREEGVTRIDCLVLTHPDKDHIGGAPAVLEAFEVGRVLQSVCQKDSDTQARLEEALQNAGLQAESPREPVELAVGKVACTVYPAEKDNYEQSNDYSMAVWAQHGKVSAFFAGDAEKARLKEILELSLPACTLYKVPHHGRKSGLSAEAILSLCPAFAVITAAEAEEEVAFALNAVGAESFYTAAGEVTALSDGEKLTVTQEGGETQ